jgi:hypothetical protein
MSIQDTLVPGGDEGHDGSDCLGTYDDEESIRSLSYFPLQSGHRFRVNLEK